MIENQINKKNVCLTILVGVFIASFFFSFLTNIQCAILMIALIVLSVFFYREKVFDHSVVFLLLFCGIQLLYMMLGNGTNLNFVLFVELQFVSAVLICNSLDFFASKQIKFLTMIMVGLYAIAILRTLFILQFDPMAVRHFGYGVGDEDAYISLLGMLSYGAGEALSFILPAFLCFAKGSRSFIVQILLILLVVIGILTQYQATLTTSFFLSIIGCFFAISFCMNDGDAKRFRSVLLLLLLIVILVSPQFSYDENTQILTKIDDASNSVMSGKLTGQASYRQGLYIQSLNVFLNNPLLGMGHWPEVDLIFKENDVSLHTALLDYLGLYGMFVLLLYYSWNSSIKRSFSYLEAQQKKYYASSFFTLTLLLIFKGPVSVGIDFVFSTVFLSLLYRMEAMRTECNIEKYE